ncbi:uncharacterized protein FA14DRAFT_178604 [Meira miltonrushii]|uniref:Uncharacterized protein n=1 Tax=Meira miltonrushii TaxID=1280837 RepID=A0A316VDT0_9BASI|nr:uncharacterized protein FA14DRAFT_178604 [Meira miltonrushii]PWN35228.1 hypothetical protein FA14DRAFT_178604 [Meira miltonrushii]
MSASTSTAKTSSNVVIRCGHIIPQIRLTPPDSRPAKAPEVPEQELGSNSLYVPLRTEEIGWEEGGLIWAPKRFYYPTVNLYGGEDDHIIGQYRGGPKGHRFIKITDSNFALANKDEDEVPSSSGTGSAGSSRKSKSQLPRGPVKMTSNTPAKEEELVKAEEATTIDSISYDDPMSTSMTSSASSSRQGSFSTDDGRSSGADTGTTTPATSESPVEEEKGVFAEKLNDALNTALKVHGDTEMSENGRHTRKLAARAGACEIPSDPVDASRLAGPLKAQLQSNPLGHDRSMILTKEVPEKHLSCHRGKSIPCLSLAEDATNEYSAGWAYEQNMQNQFSNQTSLRTQIDSEMVN